MAATQGEGGKTPRKKRLVKHVEYFGDSKDVKNGTRSGRITYTKKKWPSLRTPGKKI